jgi:hypothetical protein
VVAHVASACQTDASASAAKSATARCIVRVMACRSICLLPPEERGAKNPTCDAFDCKIRRLFVVTFRRVPRAKKDLVLSRASEPPSLTTARAPVSHAHSRPASSPLSPSAFRSDQPRSHTPGGPGRWIGSSRPTLVQLKVKRASSSFARATHGTRRRDGGSVGRDEAVQRTSGTSRSARWFPRATTTLDP